VTTTVSERRDATIARRGAATIAQREATIAKLEAQAEARARALRDEIVKSEAAIARLTDRARALRNELEGFRQDTMATIDERAVVLGSELAGLRVVADDDLRGAWPNDGTRTSELRAGQAFVLKAGRRLSAGHLIVQRYPNAFRPLTEEEIEREVANAIRRWRFEAGL
jgi:hypothetical protein